MTDRSGNPVNAVTGFLDFAARLIGNENPTYIGFAFDESLSSSFRKELFPDYKAHREPAPPELKYQFGLCREFLSAAGFAEFASNRAEADDLIGSWVRASHQHNHAVCIVTGDKDLTQLVGERDLWWEYDRDIRLDSKGVRKQHGVRPDQIADLLALAGDQSDNIPGVPGIGRVTAAKLLQKFGSIDNLLSRTPEIGDSKLRGAKRIQSLVEEYRDAIHLSRQLTTIDCHVPIDEHRGLGRMPADRQKLEDLFDLLQLTQGRRRRWISLIERV